MGRREREIAHGHFLAHADTEEVWGWGSPAGKERARRRSRLIAGKAGLGPETTALEIGCGTGVFTEYFARYGGAIIACDVSLDLLAMAKSRLFPKGQVEFVCTDFEHYETKRKFDAVVGSSVLHHLHMGRTIKKIRHILKPEGVMCFAEPNMLNPQIFLERNFRRFFPSNSPDETAFIRMRLYRELNAFGFCEIEIKPFDWLHPSIPSKVISPLKKIGRTLERIPWIKEFSGSLLITARNK